MAESSDQADKKISPSEAPPQPEPEPETTPKDEKPWIARPPAPSIAFQLTELADKFDNAMELNLIQEGREVTNEMKTLMATYREVIGSDEFYVSYVQELNLIEAKIAYREKHYQPKAES